MTEKKKILIVDDEEAVNRTIVRELLLHHEKEYDFIVATDGRDALDTIERGGLSAVILDIKMPCLDGMEVCRIMAKRGLLKTVPVIISSGNLTNETQKELGLLGVAHILHKPYVVHELFTIIKTLVSKG